MQKMLRVVDPSMCSPACPKTDAKRSARGGGADYYGETRATYVLHSLPLSLLSSLRLCVFAVYFCLFFASSTFAQSPDLIPIANDERPQVISRLEAILKIAEEKKAPLDAKTLEKVRKALADRDTKLAQELLDAHTITVVNINPEGRVKLQRGPAELPLVQNQPAYVLFKIVNLSGGQPKLDLRTEYSGGKTSPFTMSLAPSDLSGVIVEYQLLRVSCSEAGKREITIAIQAGQGTQDLGFRGELPLLFDVKK